VTEENQLIGRIARAAPSRTARAVRLLLGAAITAGAPLACSGAAPGQMSCETLQSSAIHGAIDDGGAASGVLSPLVALENEAGEIICTATLIDTRVVLTAAHCAAPQIWLRAGAGPTAVRASEARRFTHPTRDVMLIELSATPTFPAASQSPLALFTGALGPDWVGRQVTLAGFGATETGSSGTLHAVEEPVVAVDADTITVDGQGTRGACGGDSGGPLILPRGDGLTQGEILGVLSHGSTSCVGLDHYERIDTLASWIADTLTAIRANPCGDVTREGRCGGGEATYCGPEGLVRDVCASGLSCGWSVTAAGYRCVDIADDPCGGVGPATECADDAVVWCDHGTLERVDCGPCGGRCSIDPTRGAGCR
jgi:hypothetical protein